MNRISILLLSLSLLVGVNLPAQETDSIANVTMDATIDINSEEAAIKSLNTNGLNGLSIEDLVQSPRATEMNKFGYYPTNLYTGLIDISVPIYTINYKNIQVPIELKYHASGIKFDDVDTGVGLGWTLIAGGTVSCSARGATSPEPSYNNNYWIKNADDIDPRGICDDYATDNIYLRYLMNGQDLGFASTNPYSYEIKDGEYDVYTYSFLHHFGEIIFPSGPVFIPAKPMKWDGFIDGNLVISDEEGIRYHFKIYELDGYRRNVTYYLVKIEPADRSDSITFEYTTLSGYELRRPYISWAMTYYEKRVYYPLNGEPLQAPYQTGMEYSGGLLAKAFYPPVLSKIIFPGGRVEFTYHSTEKRNLQQIIIKDNNGITIRTASLEKNVFSNGQRRLDKVQFKDKNDTAVYDYQFGYNGSPGPVDKGIDFWGYYNGKSLGQGKYIPTNFTFPFPVSGINRDADETYMKGGILNKIIYPTKGYSTFTYQAHKANNVTFGGLRIYEIYNYDSNGTLFEKKWYKYGLNESGNGRGIRYPSQIDFITKTQLLRCNDSNPGRVVVDQTYFTQISSFPKISYFMSGSPVVYPYVVEYSGTGNTPNGKTVYRFSDFYEEAGFPVNGENPAYPLRSYVWKCGQLMDKTVYDQNGTVKYSLTNSYKDINTAEYQNLKVIPFINFYSGGSASYSMNEWMRCFNTIVHFNSVVGTDRLYNYYNYYNTTGLSVLDYSTEMIDGITKRTEYPTYNAKGFPTEVREQKSNNTYQVIKNKYPTEMVASVYTQMKDRNIISPVVEQNEYLRSGTTETFLSMSRSNYTGGWPNNSNLYAPGTIETRTNTQSSPEVRLQYHLYDNYGNPTCISGTDGFMTVYIWGYKGQYPVAKIETSATTASIYTTICSIIGTSDISTLNGTPTDATVRTAIQKLRATSNTSLKDAMIWTYTYNTIVGITSETDPRGHIFYYEYDNFGRLKYVKDNNATHIVNEYNYNYKNQ